MAYSFNDHYRPLRIILRLSGMVVGVGLGTFLLISPAHLLAEWGLAPDGPAWPARLAGASLLGLGVGLLAAAREPHLHPASLITVVFSNALIALVLFVSYLQQELARLVLPGRLLLVFVFSICLISVIVPIPYFRGEHRSGL
jgi:hypothetical protein